MTTYHCFYQCFNIQFDNHFDFLRSFKQTTGTITVGCEGQWNMPWWVQTLQQMKCFSKNRKQILARKHEAILLPKNRQHRGLSKLRNSNTIYVIIYSMWLIFPPLWTKREDYIMLKIILANSQNTLKPILKALKHPWVFLTNEGFVKFLPLSWENISCFSSYC